MKRASYMSICNNPTCLRPRTIKGGYRFGFGNGMIVTPLGESPIRYFHSPECVIEFMKDPQHAGREFGHYLYRIHEGQNKHRVGASKPSNIGKYKRKKQEVG